MSVEEAAYAALTIASEKIPRFTYRAYHVGYDWRSTGLPQGHDFVQPSLRNWNGFEIGQIRITDALR